MSSHHVQKVRSLNLANRLLTYEAICLVSGDVNGLLTLDIWRDLREASWPVGVNWRNHKVTFRPRVDAGRVALQSHLCLIGLQTWDEQSNHTYTITAVSQCVHSYIYMVCACVCVCVSALSRKKKLYLKAKKNKIKNNNVVRESNYSTSGCF